MKNLYKSCLDHLDANWKRITMQSYTAWAFYILIAVTLAPDLLYATLGMDTNPLVWGRLQILVAVFGIVGRVVVQKHKSRIIRRMIIAFMTLAVLSIAVPSMANENPDDVAFTLIAKWEGKRNNSYQDTVGVWTICYGHIEGVRAGQYLTDDQCRDLLIYDISNYRRRLHTYFTPETIAYRLTDKRDAAYTSLAYNVGVYGAGRSTATRRLNAGNIPGGCNALMWWNKAGGRVIRGLVLRRNDEYQYCMDGLR